MKRRRTRLLTDTGRLIMICTVAIITWTVIAPALHWALFQVFNAITGKSVPV